MDIHVLVKKELQTKPSHTVVHENTHSDGQRFLDHV
jgi:hypothetical protein